MNTLLVLLGRACGAMVVVAALWSASCAPLMKLPSGAGAPISDAAEALGEATTACRAVSTITAEIAVNGSVGGRRFRARLLAGLSAPSSARLEAVAPYGQPLFFFVARDGDATLLLPRDDRVLEHGRPEAVLEAIAAVPLDAAELRIALTGCAVAPDAAHARQPGDDWRVVPDGERDLYLHRDSHLAGWRVVAAVHRDSSTPAWRAEYGGFETAVRAGGLPRTIRLVSLGSDRFDLRLMLSQVEINEKLDDGTFKIRVPVTATPITLSELRTAGPLGR
jgi:hypothetical protein